MGHALGDQPAVVAGPDLGQPGARMDDDRRIPVSPKEREAVPLERLRVGLDDQVRASLGEQARSALESACLPTFDIELDEVGREPVGAERLRRASRRPVARPR
jgi:hypothetical protein